MSIELLISIWIVGAASALWMLAAYLEELSNDGE